MNYYVTHKPARFHRHAPRHQETEHDFRLAVNVLEEDDTYSLRADVPGLTADDLNIQVVEDVITIEGEYRSEDSKFLLHELPTGKFHRSLRMPVELDATKAEAEIKDGVLTVRVPKAEEARPKQIKISVN